MGERGCVGQRLMTVIVALVNSIRAATECVRDCRVDAFVDSQVLIDSWYGQGSRKSLELTNATKDLFFVLAARSPQPAT